jgi:hypothetical protein
MRFFRHDGIYRSDVSSPLFTPGRTRFPVGPVPRYRTRRKAHALPIVRDEFRPAIPRRVARQHCPPPLHRHHQIKTIAALNGILYHRTVASLLTVRLSAGDKPSDCPAMLMAQQRGSEPLEESQLWEYGCSSDTEVRLFSIAHQPPESTPEILLRLWRYVSIRSANRPARDRLSLPVEYSLVCVD